MRKEDVVLSLILIGCPAVLLVTGMLIRPACRILEYHIDTFRIYLSLILITFQACGWFILVKKSRVGIVTKILLCHYVVLLSIIVHVITWLFTGFSF